MDRRCEAFFFPKKWNLVTSSVVQWAAECHPAIHWRVFPDGPAGGGFLPAIRRQPNHQEVPRAMDCPTWTHWFSVHLHMKSHIYPGMSGWIVWRVFDPKRIRHWAPRAARGAYPVKAAKSRIFVQNRRFSNKKWAAKSCIFVQHRVFSSKIVAFQIRSEPQNRVFSSNIAYFRPKSSLFK